MTAERRATIVLVGLTAFACLALVFAPTKSTGDSHAHGHGGGSHSEELAIELDDDALESAGMIVEKAQEMEIHPHLSARGQITENGNRSMNVRPRFSGIVKSVHKDFGERVQKGELLLQVESATTRSSYAIRTAIDGIVADKRVVSGAFIPENESVFRIVDLNSVWFQARLPIRDADKVQVGFSADIKDQTLGVKGSGRVIYVSPVVDEDTQTCDVRIELENSKGEWRIGSFAESEIFMAPISVKVAVKSAAVQTLGEQTIIFKRHEDRIVAVPVTLGWFDDEWTEVLTGLKPGESYLAANSFIAKAELLKSTAEHEH